MVSLTDTGIQLSLRHFGWEIDIIHQKKQTLEIDEVFTKEKEQKIILCVIKTIFTKSYA